MLKIVQSKDLLWQKIFVGALVALDALSTVLAMSWACELFIDGWGDISAFESGDWLLASDPMLAGIAGCMVQSFFAWRLHIVAKQRLLTIFILFCSLGTLVGGVGTGIAVLWVKSYALFDSFKQITCICLISAAVGDVTITAAFSYHLRRRKGSFKATDRLLDRIILLTVQNGLLTALVALTDVTLFLSSVFVEIHEMTHADTETKRVWDGAV
ncbi:hypothetical protein HWV62_39104 [Athelia sp. TMB]|nr:hypothetical protein HWV62_34419 [Athelia sp. TMB]KAF7980310.1 hypothetical protein HWV62_39104 [Athelia sp. TMB]